MRGDEVDIPPAGAAVCSGPGGRNESESVAEMVRNMRPRFCEQMRLNRKQGIVSGTRQDMVTP